MRRIIFTVLCGWLVFAADALLLSEPADARGGFRASSRGFSSRGFSSRGFSSRMKVSRMKTYHFNGKQIHGYRNFIRERRAAKLASGGYKVRSDGSVVHRDFRIRTGRLSTKPLELKQMEAPKAGVVQGQCRDGTRVDQGRIDWGCRHAGGIGWSHQPPRINGIRDY